ncbi:MAG: metalloregulator ArsR/SmtB family transcription factor [Bifidobacteriaceae bacterium]|jgi:DNA-binding transcriptional ArsR family regulator|nr:metalloregulator ArsR/SmtB family transcription factor [Bifidobacteriaceae bacterium]MCI1978812.1 metalloregulator ArsR/SmtB family transcription factor [Bifidobacteriaceae bacterium]
MYEDSNITDYGSDNSYIELAVNVFSLLADPTRIRIVLALKEGEMSVGQLAEHIGKSQTAVSQHLAKMRWGRLVETRQEGTRVYYKLSDEHAINLVDQAIFQAEHVVDGIPAHHMTAKGGKR